MGAGPGEVRKKAGKVRERGAGKVRKRQGK